MFPIVLRGLILVGVILVILLYVLKQCRKIELTEETRVKLEETKIVIDEVLKEAKDLPEVNQRKLQKAKDDIEKFLRTNECKRRNK